MTACDLQSLRADIPAETMELLLAFVAATNSKFDNATGRVIRDGIEASMVLHPHLRERMGAAKPHRMSVAVRLSTLHAKEG